MKHARGDQPLQSRVHKARISMVDQSRRKTSVLPALFLLLSLLPQLRTRRLFGVLRKHHVAGIGEIMWFKEFCGAPGRIGTDERTDRNAKQRYNTVKI